MDTRLLLSHTSRIFSQVSRSFMRSVGLYWGTLAIILSVKAYQKLGLVYLAMPHILGANQAA